MNEFKSYKADYKVTTYSSPPAQPNNHSRSPQTFRLELETFLSNPQQNFMPIRPDDHVDTCR